MRYGYQWFVFAVGFCYGLVVGGVLASGLFGW